MKAALCTRSARTGMAIAYAAAGTGESTTSYVFDGVCAIAARGELLACSNPLSDEPFVYADVRPDQLTAFEPYAATVPEFGRYISADAALAAEELARVLDLQAAALCRRLTHIHGKGFVIGVSGGLDSALALLAATVAADRLAAHLCRGRFHAGIRYLRAHKEQCRAPFARTWLHLSGDQRCACMPAALCRYRTR